MWPDFPILLLLLGQGELMLRPSRVKLAEVTDPSRGWYECCFECLSSFSHRFCDDVADSISACTMGDLQQYNSS